MALGGPGATDVALSDFRVECRRQGREGVVDRKGPSTQPCLVPPHWCAALLAAASTDDVLGGFTLKALR